MRKMVWGGLATLTLWGLLALCLDQWGSNQRPDGVYDAVVVAGCRVDPNGEPSQQLVWRVRIAVDLWKQGVAKQIVFTGGLGDYPPTEAEASAKLAASLGVPRSAMLLEDRSTSTEENARNAAEEMTGARRVLVVTSAYHVFRARRVFARYFEEVDGVGSTYGKWSRVRGALREVVAVGSYGVRGRL